MRLGSLVGDTRVHGLRVEQRKNGILLVLSKGTKERKDGCFGAVFVTRASVGEWGLSRTKVCSGAVGVLRVAISGSR